MKNLLLKSLALCCVFTVVGCEKNREVDDPMTRGETTTPHSMETAPVNPNNELHDDMQHASSPAITEEHGSSEVQTGKVTSNSGASTTS